MGDPRKARRTYSSPKKPWDKPRLDAERIIVKEYGIVNKLELRKMEAILRDYAFRAKRLIASTTQQGEQERKALLSKLSSLALIAEKAQLDDVLALEIKNILERRLQTMVVRKNLANTMRQARQFIVHRHIKVGDSVVTAPSFIVSKEDETKIAFVEKSSLANPEHPERPEQIFKMKAATKKAKEAPAAPVESAETAAKENADVITPAEVPNEEVIPEEGKQ